MKNTERAAYSLRAALAVLVLIITALPANATPPYKYYVLTPEPLAADLAVTSLEAGNTISAGAIQRSLSAYESTLIPATELFPGAIISGSAPYTVGSNANAADLLAPDFLAGTEFVIPHITGSHKYYVQATTITANLTITIGAAISTLEVIPGTAYEIDAGSDNSIAGRLSADQPVVVAHVAYVSGAARDAYPVPPASLEVLGIRSQNAIIGANTDGTSVTVYASDGTSGLYALDAGQTVAITVGSGSSQGGGSAVRVVANHPVAAVQYDDGDGADASGFWLPNALRYRHAIPVNAQYVAVACLHSNVTVTLFRGSTAPQTQTCSSNGTDPGKAFFGAGASGSNIPAGWHLHADAPVYVMYEAASPEDEHNLSGTQTIAGPSAPTLDPVTTPTVSNPVAVTGTAGANATVRLYVNGRLQQTTSASGAGGFSFSTELYDGNNVVHAVAVNGADESAPSNVVEVVYSNTIPRTQSGTLSGNVVWTPGSPATPYVISSSLTVAAGAKLVLQPGATLKFANGASLTVNGTLKISGTSATPVTLTSNAASPARGSWTGIVLNSTAGGAEIWGALIEYVSTGVYVNGVVATIRNSTIRYFSTNGILMSGAGASGGLIEGNLIDNLNDSADCIEAVQASPLIKGNTITNCDFGLHLNRSDAVVSGNNVITGNNYGIQMWGGSGIPQPVVTGNQIFANDNLNVRAEGFGTGGSNVTLNYTGNWWGTTEATTIAGKIHDLSDSYASATLPTVDYSAYLNGPNGSAVAGNYLIGRLTATTTTLTAGATYQVLGTLFVPNGSSLTIPAGTTLRFHANAFLVVDGTLTVSGTSGNPVTLTSGRSSPARGNWAGVYIRGGSGTLMEHAVIEWTSTGVNVNGVAATIRNSTIRYFSTNGILMSGAGASGGLIEGNLIDNLNDSMDCIEVVQASPAITGNTITNCDFGLHLNRSDSLVSGNNVITGNNLGIQMWGGNGIPQPAVTGNQIYGNDGFNVRSEGFGTGASNVTLNYTGNWWGTTDATTIAGKILDLSDSYTSATLPIVDYSGYLDGPNGSAVSGNHLMGRLTATSTTLTAGATYEVLGALFVPSGSSLTIPAGTTLRFHANAFLVVDGTLTVSGTSGNPVTLTSGRSSPARGNWTGVSIRSGSGTLIEYAVIEWTSTGVNVNGVAATIRNSTIRYFSTNGILMSGAGASGGLIEGNLIDNLNDTADCIEVLQASPAIIGNTLSNCNFGLHLNQSSSVVSGNNVITGNEYGIQMWGGDAVPQPAVTGNQIFENTYSYVRAEGFGTGASSVTLNYTGNWWGTTDPTTITGRIYDLSDSQSATTLPLVNYSGYLDGPNGSPVAGNHLGGHLTATSTALTGGVTYEVMGGLIVPSGKSLTIPAGATLRFHGDSFLTVDGTLIVSGTSGNLVTLTSGRPSPARGNWTGVYIRGGSGTLIEHALIEWASTGVNVNAVASTIRNSTVRNFSANGILISGAGANGGLIEGSLIDNLDDTADCIEVVQASPAIAGNTITNCNFGLHLNQSSSVVSGNNVITGNNYGIQMAGGNGIPLPVVTGNQLVANDNLSVRAEGFGAGASSVLLNYTGNWWGTVDPTAIAASIQDLSDSYGATSIPIVDYSAFLDGPGGSAVSGNFLIGEFVTASTTLVSGATYDVLGPLLVPGMRTLTIPAGVVLRFHDGAALVVDGTLHIQGTSSSRVQLTRSESPVALPSWQGIVIRNSATDVVIDYALIEWVVQGVEVQTAAVTIQNSVIRNFTTAGIAMSGSGGTSQILGNTIENYSSAGDGVNLASSSPAISGNRISGTNRAIYMSGASNPILSGNVLTDNNWGIYLFGNSSNSASEVPNPFINGNDIFGNASADLEVNAYGPSNPVEINGMGNWWGTPDPAVGVQIRFSTGTLPSILDFSYATSTSIGFDTQAPTAPVALSAIAVSSSQIDLSWTPATDNFGVTGYVIERCSGTGCSSFVEIATAPSTNFSDVGLSSSTHYRYRVRARDAANLLSAYSGIADSVAEADSEAPTVPGALDVTAVSSTQINTQWGAAVDNIRVVAYLIERCQGSGCSNFAPIATVTQANFRDTGLVPNSSYSYRVRARDAVNNLGGYSNVDSVTTPVTGADCD